MEQSPAPERTRSVRDGLVAFAACCAASVVMFSPFAPLHRLGDTLPWGDAVQFAFFEAWGRHILLSGKPGDLFNLPISHPLPVAGGLTDILPGVSFFTLPLAPLGFVAAYNVATLIFGALNAFCCWLLARDQGASRSAALVGGFLFAFNGFMVWHAAGHHSVLASWWMPLAFLAAMRFLRSGSWKWAAAAASLLMLQGMTSSRMGIILLVGLLVFTAVHALLGGAAPGGPRPLAARVGRGSLWVGLLLLAMVPMSVLYAPAAETRKALPHKRGLIDVINGSADPVGYLLPSEQAGRDLSPLGWVLGPVLPEAPPGERRNYLGLTPWILLAIVAWKARRAREQGSPWRDPEVYSRPRLWIALALASIVLSLGPYLWIGGSSSSIPLPWLATVKAIPPLSTFRVPARFAAVAGLALAVAVALALTHLLQARSDWDSRRRFALTAGVLGLLFMEFYPLSPMDRLRVADNPIRTYLRTAAPRGAVVSMPYNETQNVLLDYVPSFPVTLDTFHGGLRNAWVEYAQQQLLPFPEGDSIPFLQSLGVGTILVRNEELAARLSADPRFENPAPGVFLLEGVTDKAMEVARREGLRDLLAAVPAVENGEFPAPLGRRILRGAEDRTIWGQVEMNPPTLVEGALRFEITGPDPSVWVGFSEPPEAEDVTSVLVSLRYPRDRGYRTPVTLYWTDANGAMSELATQEASVLMINDWQVVRFPVAAHRRWPKEGVIARLRIDPANPGFPGELVDVSAVALDLRPLPLATVEAAEEFPPPPAGGRTLHDVQTCPDCWGVTELAVAGVAGRFAAFAATGKDPSLWLRPPQPIDPATVQHILVHMRYPKGDGKQAPVALYWEQDGAWSEECAFWAEVPRKDEWMIVRFPVGEVKAWKRAKPITRLRLDPANPGTAGELYLVNGVALDRHAPP